MIYQIPEDPRTSVWDKNRQEWEPDKPGYYGRKFGSIRRIITWADLIVSYGPLTERRLPEVGETFTVVDGHELLAEDFPEGAVFVNDTCAAIVLEKRFEYSVISTAVVYLHPDEWTRLR